jgi:SSS family solute:Na+ symporter
MVVYITISAYLLITLLIGFIGYRSANNTPEDYFLAGRKMGPFLLFFTFIATNFSAFFFLGFSGEGYRIGYSYYVMMAFGTIFAALSFYFIGYKTWLLGKQNGYVTPVEMIGGLSGSQPLKLLYLGVMLFFTLPYLALQPIGAGYILTNLTSGAIPYFTGASVLTGFIVIYVFSGGMRSVAITDLMQGLLMFTLMGAAVWVIAKDLGGLESANKAVFEVQPALFSREGLGNYFTPKKWFSLLILWTFCVPMFPQMFMRFFVPKDVKALKISTFLYALIPTILFICPVIIGVLAHLSFPGLEGKEADQVLPMMLMKHAPEWLAALIMVGALAAFMSTLDSQLLALSTLFTRDLYLPFINSKAGLKKQVMVGRAMVVLAAGAGLAIAYQPPDTLFVIAKETFTGFSVLFPTTLALLHHKKVPVMGCITSIVLGEGILAADYMGIIPEQLFLGFDPIVIIMTTAFAAVYLPLLFTKTVSRS